MVSGPMKHFTRILLPLVFALALTGTGRGRPLSDTETRITHWVDTHLEEAFAFLEGVVNVNSGTMNFAGVRRVGRMFRDPLDALGFRTKWIPMEEVNRAGHLFAEIDGGGGDRLLLIGHLDTVFEADSPFQQYQREASLVRGPGVEDMKGGNVVLLFALKALQDAGVLEQTRLIVALTGDEESTGKPLATSRAHLLEAARRSQVALGFEGGVDDLGTATIARRGFSGWELEVQAGSGHSSQIFAVSVGAGAIFEAARILHLLYQELRGEPQLSFSPGLIVGGTTAEYDAAHSRGTVFGKTNVIPQRALVAGDLRFISQEQRESAQQRMQAIVNRNLPGSSAVIRFQDSYPAMSPSPENYALLERLDQVSRDLGYGPVRPLDPGRRGAADVSFAAPHVRASMDGLGPVGWGGHTVDERIDSTTLGPAIKRAALLIYRLTGGD